MPTGPIPGTAILRSPQRLAVLDRTGLLDAPSEEAFDRLARLAARLLDVPVALVSLVTDERQFFTTCIGLPEPWQSERQTPLSHSFCQHVVATTAPLVIEDARDHPLVKDNLAIRDLGVVAYLGIPLTTSDGQTLGSFCAIDSVPRRWSEDEIALMHDLTASVVTELEQRIAHAALRESEARFRAAFEDAAIGMALVSTQGQMLRVNRALCEMLGFAADELLARTFQELTHPDDLDADLELLRQVIADEIGSYSLEKRYTRRDGRTLWGLLSVSLVRDGRGRPLYFIGQVQDIHERKLLEQQLRHDALHDALTGLPNRRLFEDQARQAFARARRSGQPLALLLLDLDGFKQVNDTWGHEQGDRLIRAIATRMREAIREGDTVARLGGDEFAMVLEGVDAAGARQFAERMIATIAAVTAADARTAGVTASAGIALGHSPDGASDALLHAADAAMYAAKRAGRNRVCVAE